MKITITLFLLIITLNTTANAQVKIGHNAAGAINDAALLELSNDTSASPSSWKALLLPVVDFTNAVFTSSAVWGIAGTATEGTTIYNKGNRTTNGYKGTGLYIWLDNAWTKL